MLNLSPKTERRARELAHREGINADDVLTHLLDKAEVGLSPLLLQRRINTSSDEQRARILALLSLSREEIKQLNAPSIALLQSQMESAKDATPEEIAEADREWDGFKRSLHENKYGDDERFPYRG